MLRLYNSLSRQKEGFVPITPRKVNMYVCGMTVYDRCHLGHARMFLVFDMVYRWLMSSGYDVTYVRNITDIDDNIIARAAQNNEPVEALTARMIEYMNRDLSRLMVLKPSHEPRATQFVPEMVELIQTLIDRDLAYPAENGDVYYSVHKFTGYGKLSGKTLDDLRAGERVEIGTHKRDPLDFVLWKASKPNEPKWPSPWGEGRPGWHIECSAMSEHFLGSHFDIHGGGHDLQFPHHENEIAQSEGAHRHTFVNYWMHNGFLRVNDEKMSKSLGNFFLIDDVLKEYPAEVIRFFMLRGHYRGPINYTVAHLADAKQALTTLYLALRDVSSGAESAQVQWDEPHAIRFKAAMDDDFNTPEALAVLFDLAHEVNRTKAARQAGLLKGLGGMLGLLQQDARSYLQGGEEAARPEDATAITAGSGAYTAEAIESLITARAAARKQKQFAESDRIRNELVQAGIILEDGPQGTTWRRK